MAIIRSNNNKDLITTTITLNGMEEMRMFFDKINNGSPFGVIKEVFFYDFPSNNPNKLTPTKTIFRM
ncbi:hypothetical protein BD0140_07610 [Helicobacter pylori]